MTPILYLMACLMSPSPLIDLAESRGKESIWIWGASAWFTPLGKGLPIGLMICTKGFDEATALRVGYAYEQATAWHRQTPDLSWASERMP